MKRNSLKIRKNANSSSAGGIGGGNSTSSYFWKTASKHKGNIFKVILGAVAFLLMWVVWNKSTRAIQNLVNVDIEDVKNALVSDTPYIFYCDRNGNDRLPGIFTDLHLIKGSKISFAAVNCSQVLPSGKNIWDRFKLRKEIRPTIFGTAPWMKPKQAEVQHLKDTAALQKFVDTRMVPQATPIHSDKELQKFCGFDRNLATDENNVGETCLVIVKGTRFTKAQTDLIQKVVLKHPKVKIAQIDATKNRLSVENTEAMPADAFAIKIHALRYTHTLTARPTHTLSTRSTHTLSTRPTHTLSTRPTHTLSTRHTHTLY